MSDLRTAAPMASENQEEAPLVETLRATAEVVGRPRSVMLNKAADEIDRLRDLNRQLVDKANGYVIHNARLADENQRLRAELAAPTAQPLTTEAMDNIVMQQYSPDIGPADWCRDVARAVERAHGIGGTHGG